MRNMPSKTIHLEITRTILSLDKWRYLNRIEGYVFQHIGDPDVDGLQDGYILTVVENRMSMSGLIPHHGANTIAQKARTYYFWNALCYYLRNDYAKGGECFARALHYAQDFILAYSAYNQLHSTVEDDIERLWHAEKESIIREITSELKIIANRIDRGEYDINFEIASTPKLYLVNATRATYYLMKLFERMVDLARVQAPKLAKRKRLYRLLLVASLPLMIIPPIGVAMLATGLVIRRSVRKHRYLLWATGYEKLDMTTWEWSGKKRTRKGSEYLTYVLRLQPYVRPCLTRQEM